MGRGRPRKVDPETVLDAIMMTFWKHGYLDTTMSHLTQATQMAKPGLYSAFGDKEALYQVAIKHYQQEVADPMLADVSDSKDDVKQVFKRYLDRVASSVLNPLGPKGCFISNGLVQCPVMSDELKALSQDANEFRRNVFLTRLKKAADAGEIKSHCDLEALSQFLMAQVLAITVLARSGSDKATLDQLIQVAISNVF